MARKGRRPPRGSIPPRGVGGGGAPDIQQLLQQAAEMQSAVQESRAALAEATFEGTAGGGVVKAVVSGSGDLRSVDIDPSVLDPDDPEMVGDLVVAAVAQAMEAMKEAAVSSLGLGSPDGLDLGSLGLDDLGGLLG